MQIPKPLFQLISFTLLAAGASAQTSPSAEYTVRFDATWSSTTHPSAYPNFAHFSPLIGATHTPFTHLWQPGGMATQGIEVMAETGAPGVLANEINNFIMLGLAGELVQGGGTVSPGGANASFTATTTNSHFSMVTMIAPSPDWFLGVNGVPLLENGIWVDSVEVDLYAYDAGTDNGMGFNSSNSNTNPQASIALMTSGPFFGTTRLGTLTISLDSAASYCNGKLNSQGTLPTISAMGSPSATQAGSFNINGSSVINNKNGLLFYGFASNSLPFQGGTLCVGGSLTRTTVQNSGGNAGGADSSGSFSFDMNALIQTGMDANLSTGQTVYTQYWFRDPQSPSGSGLTNGLEFVIAP